MKGSTNALGKKQGEVEMLNLSLLTNQLSHDDLLGATITVEYGSASKTYTWEGISLTINVPAYVDYTVTFGEVEGYRKPSSVTYTAQNGNRRTLNAKYETEVVSVTLAADDNSSVNGAQVEINGTIHTWNGTALTQKVAFGTTYTVEAGDLDGFVTPDSQTYTADQSSRSLSFVYKASAIKVNILSNQDNDSTIAAVKATVTWVNPDQSSGDEPHMAYVGNGETVNIPSNVNVNITFPEVEGYKAPSPISFTHTGGQAEKTGTYQCELLTVNVTSDNGSVSGYEVTISKQETVGVATKYTKLEYIESNGTQYIDTGFKPNQDTRVVMDLYSETNVAASQSHVCFGSDKFSYGGSMVNAGLTVYGSSSFNLGSGYGMMHIDFNKTDISVLFTSYDTPVTQEGTHTANTFSSNTNLTLVNDSNSYKIYSCQVYDNGTLVRDYIPALRSDGIAGLYDSVNDTFTASSGTGNFSFNSDNQEVIATQTNVTGTYKIPFDTSYTVTASAVIGYTSPAKVSRVASAKSYTVNQEYKVITVRDLSLYDIYGNPINRSTANCYVVNEPGQYKFPCVYGNAIKNGKVNTAAFTNNGGSYSHDFEAAPSGVIDNPYIDIYSGYQAILLNTDTDDVISNIRLIEESDCWYVYFDINSIPNSGANGIISIDSNGWSMWSWHIWLWPYDLSPVEITNSTGVKYNIMPVNLASKYDSDRVHIKNWFYQWGRKDPMLCPASYDSSSNHSPGTITTESKTDSIGNGILYPTKFYYNSSSPYNWFGTQSYYNLWDAACTGTGDSDNDTVKTVYDPCPVGWKVPNGNTFTGLSIISESNGIVKMARYSGDTTGVEFPLSGSRDYTSGSLYGAGEQGTVWLSSAESQRYACTLLFRAFDNGIDYDHRANGCSIRPVEDDNIQLDVIMISFTIDGTSYQAESGMTWFEWVNSEYNTGGFTSDGNRILEPDGTRVVYMSPSTYIKPSHNIIGGQIYITTFPSLS